MKEGVFGEELPIVGKITKQRRSLVVTLAVLSAIYSIIIVPCIIVLIRNRSRFSDYRFEPWLYFTTITVATVLHILVIMVIRSIIRRLDKELVNLLEFISLLKSTVNWEELLELLNTPLKIHVSSSKREEWIIKAMYQLEPIETIKYLTRILEEESFEELISIRLITLFSYIIKYEDVNYIYGLLFDSILAIQKEYFEAKLHGLYKSNQSYLFSYPKNTRMNELTSMFGFYFIDDFITYNILMTFTRIFNNLEPEQPVHLKRLVELCRASDEKVHSVLKQLLELYPELGRYQEFEMLFVPTKKIINYEEIVDFDSISKREELTKEPKSTILSELFGA